MHVFDLRVFCIVLLLGLGTASGVEAQELSPRFGVGLNGLVSTEDGFGLGVRGRASAPLNADVSVAVDLGATGFVLGGREDATYVFEPQLSVVVNLPFQGSRLPYLLAGVGGHIPLSETNSTGGPVLHVGYGRVQSLQETSLFYEINPGLLIGEEGIDLLIPVRVGLIFR